MPVKICYSFVARHAPQYGEWIAEIREMRKWKLLCVFGRVRYCWSLPDKIMLPQVSGNSCYSHRVAEYLGDPKLHRELGIVAIRHRRATNINAHRRELSSRRCAIHLYSQCNYQLYGQFCRSFIVVMFTRYRRKHSRRFLHLFAKFGLVCFLYMPTLVN